MAMKPADFKRWRKHLGLSQKDAAQLLGLKRRMVQYYEKGQRDGFKVAIPKTVRLACYAVADGVADYTGPPRVRKKTKPKPKIKAGSKAGAKAKPKEKTKPKVRPNARPAVVAARPRGRAAVAATTASNQP
jgi:transcriptional regulator with XRE-family HTH domain